MKKKFNVTGMMCASCQANVDHAVKKIDGVTSVNVSLLANNMVVDFDESKVNDETIISAVENVGYGASPFVNESLKKIQEKKRRELRARLTRLIVSLCLLALLMVVSMGGMTLHEYGHWPSMDDPNFSLIAFLEVTLQILVLIPIIIINFNYFTSGFKSLFKLHPNMNSLIALGSTISALYSLYSYAMLIVAWADKDVSQVHLHYMNLYFEAAAMILVFVSIGKYFEKRATNKTTESITSLMALTPDTAYVIRNGEEVEVQTESLLIDDIVVVKPGQSIPTDGVILDGYGDIDESTITGESLPIHKSKGDKVIGATINKNGSFTFKVTSVGKDTTISQIIGLVEKASESKAPMARLADKISLIFVPTVIGLSIVTFVVWMILTNLNIVPLAATRTPLSLSLRFAITVLVISCPCALGLATPVAIMVGTGKGAENGILIKSAEAFEGLEKVDTVLFDKTGTLTKGEMSVRSIKIYEGDEASLLKKAAAVEIHSEHPLSKAVVAEAKKQNIKFSESKGFEYVPGLGVKGADISIGNASLMKNNGVNITKAEEDFRAFSTQGWTPLYVAEKDSLIGLIAIGDEIKNNSKSAIKSLQNLGKKVAIVTGDNKVTAMAIAKALGVDEVYAEVLPGDKEEIVSRLQKEGHKVAFVGDGVNDAPALTRADIGIAIGAGSDIAIDSADIILVRSDPLDVVSAIELSHKVVLNIKENLGWAFFYNILLIPLAAGVLYPYVVMQPMYGSIAMSISSVTVVLNALRLRLFKRKVINKGE
ncbi:MAG: heavy metal translocating P-type ATPase [Bacilli bacterium]|nr:heavy metal translocating P-type ATPase [Bacilli bacterium]